MRLHVTDFVDNRIEEIADQLYKTNSEYAKAVDARKESIERLDPLLSGDDETVLSPGDRENIQTYMAQEFSATAVEQRSFYRQGYLDCVDLLQGLGVL